jgi:hypothetical protein
MHIDNNFNWKTHVTAVCSRLRSVLSKLYHLNRVVSKKTMLVVYYALADSVIGYGLSVYGRTFQTYLDEIKKLQIRSMKYLVSKKTKNNLRGDYDRLYKICKILPIHQRVQYMIAVENYFNNEYKVFKQNKYRTKNVRANKYVQNSAKNYYGKRANIFMIPKIYNETDWLREEKKCSKVELKSRLKKTFLEKLH